VVTLRAEWPREFCSIPRRGKVFLSCFKAAASYLTGTGSLLSQPRRKAGRLPQYRSDVKNAW
jgi:hypothetical protein